MSPVPWATGTGGDNRASLVCATHGESPASKIEPCQPDARLNGMLGTRRLEGPIGVEVGASESRVVETTAERRAAFARFTQVRLDRAYRLAAMVLDDAEEAQDAVHDAAEQAWRDWPSLRDASRFDAWFDAIVVHRCRDRLRRRKIRPLPVTDPTDLPGADPYAGSAERDALARVLETLDPDHRIVVRLRYGADLSLAEIAVHTGEREGTVKPCLHCALRKLRAAYDAAERLDEGRR
jgi:RNA polymerase sigma-70 factor (ECF subfamily)